MRRAIRLGVLVWFGIYAACATATEPSPSEPGAADASADAKKKDTGADDGAAGGDSAASDDADTQDVDTVDADADTDANDTDAADAGSDATTNEGGVVDASDASQASDVTDASSVVDANDAASTVDAADASDASSATDANDAASIVDASDASATSDASDAASTVDAADAADAGCNDLVYGSPTLTIEQVASNAPTVSGGGIADGTYNLTAYNKYTGTNGASGPGTWTLRSTVRIQGNHVDMLTTDYTGIEKRQSGTYTTSGADITIQWTCPAPIVETGKFNVATNKFAYYPVWTSTIAYEAVHTK